MLIGYRGIIAALVALLGEVLKLMGIELGQGEQEGIINTIMIVGGIAGSIYFSYKKNERVSDLKEEVKELKQEPQR